MIGVILFINSRGDIILSRALRDGMSIRQLGDTFKHSVVMPRMSDRSPINIIDGVAYCHMRHSTIYIVVCSNTNVNCILVFQYIERLLHVIMAYLGPITELAVKEHNVTIQEIIDETLDFGYPQITEIDFLKSYITTSKSKADIVRKPESAAMVSEKANSRIPWRKEGIVYKVNEAFLHVVEEVNILMGKDGETLQRDIVGRIIFRSYLSGMPECQVILNDKMMIERAHYTHSNNNNNNNSNNSNNNIAELGGATDDIEFDDVTFHPCVRLTTFDKDRSICFVPPDGECTLMTYRTSGGTFTPPIRLIMPHIKEVSTTRMEIDFSLKTDFPLGVTVRDCIVRIPCPVNTANVKIRVKHGKGKYDPTAQAIVWKLKSLYGREEIQFSAEVALIAATDQSNAKGWTRPPLTLKFLALQYACSGLKVESLVIREGVINYNAKKWVKYLTTGGQYQCRL